MPENRLAPAHAHIVQHYKQAAPAYSIAHVLRSLGAPSLKERLGRAAAGDCAGSEGTVCRERSSSEGLHASHDNGHCYPTCGIILAPTRCQIFVVGSLKPHRALFAYLTQIDSLPCWSVSVSLSLCVCVCVCLCGWLGDGHWSGGHEMCCSRCSW